MTCAVCGVVFCCVVLSCAAAVLFSDSSWPRVILHMEMLCKHIVAELVLQLVAVAYLHQRPKPRRQLHAHTTHVEAVVHARGKT